MSVTLVSWDVSLAKLDKWARRQAALAQKLRKGVRDLGNQPAMIVPIMTAEEPTWPLVEEEKLPPGLVHDRSRRPYPGYVRVLRVED